MLSLRPFLLGAVVLLLPLSAFAQSGLWQDVNEPAMLSALSPQRRASAKRDIVPEAYRTLRLDLNAMRSRLAAAPAEFSAPMPEAGLEITIPLPYGGFGRFLVLDSPIMEKGLADKYPMLKTYVAQGIDDPAATARIDLTPRGFRAIILTPRGQYFIDPYWKDEDQTYISYFKRNLKPTGKPFVCHTPPEEIDLSKLNDLPPVLNAAPTGASLRRYRLAVAATAEYTAAVSGTSPGTVLQGLAAVITSVNRVSAIYERDLAVRFLLVANNDLLIYTDMVGDPYSDSDGGPSSLISQNQTNITNVIGAANYDLGHVFSTNGGGLASTGLCADGSKARGVTGTTQPTGDPYDVDYVAHEMGHQMAGSHTFNSAMSSCNGNRVATSAYEPGSGTTIMAYAGICGSSNLAAHSDDYFHARSFDQIDTRVSNASVTVGGCRTNVATGNTPPVIAALPGPFSIPRLTPFALTASATDVDGDTLTYCWEEFDLGGANEPSARDNGSSPIFRSYDPSLSPTRYFPSLQYVLDASANDPAGTNQPPVTVGGFSLAETLPTTSRNMTYRVTVRDNRAGGGGSDFKTMVVSSVATAGPFRFSSFTATSTIAGGTSIPVTWDVANTTAAPINCANVKISLSTDGGLTFPIVLLASTPNNGSANVTIPNVAQVATTQGRLKIEAVGNVFFDINKANLTFTSTNAAPVLALNPTPNVTVTRGAASAVTTAVGSASDANGNPLTVSVSDAPADTTVIASINAGVISLTAQANCSIATTLSSRTYPMKLTVTDSIGSTASGTVNLVVQPNPAPTLGAYANTNVPRDGTTAITPPALLADANGNLPATPLTVSPTAIPGGGTLSVNQTTGVVYAAATTTSTLGAFNVRVTAVDSCGAAIVRQFAVTIVAAAANVAPQLVSAAPLPMTVGTAYAHNFVATGSPAPTYSLLSGTLPAGLTLSAAGVLSGTPTATGTGSFLITVRAANGVAPAFDQTYNLSVRTNAVNYLASFSLSGIMADQNGDGVRNLLAYALGLNPTLNNAGSLPVVGIKDYHGVPYAFMTFNRSSAATDLTYRVQSSNDLVNWTTILTSSGGAAPSGGGFVAETGTAPIFTVEARDLQPVDPVIHNHTFLRLLVTTP